MPIQPTNNNLSIDSYYNNDKSVKVKTNEIPIEKVEPSKNENKADEKAFFKTFEKQCQEILNEYKHEMDPLNPKKTN